MRLVPAAALVWGLQFAFLTPALALVLVSLFHAGDAEVGWVLAAYNGSGFLASLIVPRTPIAGRTTSGRCSPAGC